MPTQQHEPSDDPKPSKLVLVPIVVGVLLLISYFGYFGAYRSEPPGDPESWGQFGDFLGGLLNPVVGTITIVLLVRTLLSQEQAIRLQTEELTLARADFQQQLTETRLSTQALADQHQAIVRQSFEQAFFAWLQSYREFVTSLNAGQLQGFQVLHHMAKGFASQRLEHVPDFPRWATFHISGSPLRSTLQQRYETAQQGYEASYKSNHAILGPLLRSLYRLIDWIDKSPIHVNDKWHYVAIVRSQLTWPEMMIVAFNGTTERGQNFVPLIEKYALLDNLESDTDMNIASMRGPFLERIPKGFPYSLRAFDSKAAKADLGIHE